MEDYAISDDEHYGDDCGFDEHFDDDCGFSDGFEEPESESRRPNEEASSSQVITKDSLLAAQRGDLQKVMDLLSVKDHHARTLLIHYRWDVDKVFTVFVEMGKEWLFKEAGVTLEEHNDLSPVCSSSGDVRCDICMEDFPANETTTMDCGHCFCNECWTEHFIVKIKEGQSRRIRCMAHKCNTICDEGKIRNLVCMKHPDLAEKFDRFLLESYIEDNKMVKWCPSVPHCGNAIRVGKDKYCEVECDCGMQFCFNCSSEAHSPCSCLMWKRWMGKCQNESETVNWITVHTKPCPKCLKAVEKNGGCNLVYCICGQTFCWLCGAATGSAHTWDSIQNHSCGRYTEEQEKNLELAKKYLWRYIHYHNRYKAHSDSLKAEVQLKEKIYVKISKLETGESASQDLKWVENGLYTLFRSRRALSYSYPFAYYMFGHELFQNEMTEEEREIKQNLFEDQQQQFEANVEKLSMVLEEPFEEYTEDKVTETRMKVLNLSYLVDNLCRTLYECIENDLLGALQHGSHNIAPYKSTGAEKASKLA
ncbi:probable E3 ubiquitin-protein ligase ARI1 isoform X1 [Rhododendron vialii]|uniref:probable E3 ubiquitin-protein ligase ARI1 isoform X1 n=1 Tax=Rhododendron vialii TaxID=182163 RepID=UPI00265F5365|nr:probable E3 ubiquitin-protein ligase ARI1 isoform X1 [Rhododendron vialii]